jgi:hypothetical protein
MNPGGVGLAGQWYGLLLATLAVWRVTHFLHAEAGPFDLVVRMRTAAGSGPLGRLLGCFYCLSLWVSAPAAVWLGRSNAEGVLLWFAISAAAIGVDRLIGLPANQRATIIEDEEE